MVLAYIDKIETKKHLMLVYDDIQKGREVEFHFIRRGLEKNERGIYLTHGDPKLIESDMERYGINVKYYKKNKMLYVYKIPSPLEYLGDILTGVENMIKQFQIDLKTPFRIVGRLIPDIGFEESMSVQHHIEKTFHASFDNFGGSVMCTYEFSEIQSNNMWRDWLAKLELCHHATLFNICENSQVMINA